MIILKLIFWVVVFYVAVYLFFKFFGPLISKRVLRYFVKKAQEDLDRQTRTYEQHAEGYSPFEDNVFLDDDVKVSIPKANDKKEEKPSIDEKYIEEVDYEDVD
ncbi:MAG: hypothetical protein AAGN35_05810 [Bacteroidota bacterium]